MADRSLYLGPHDGLRLDLACRPIAEAFGGPPPYLVGSVHTRQDYRDVDVRLIVTDDRYRQLFAGSELLARLINCALSDWLAAATGLPVDFQVQAETEADRHDGPRDALGIHQYDQAPGDA